eukprot:m.1271 g.1271  ORF g.1271 m.1271 type:complete len:58 (-) comp1120_c0_seq1:54-227(-)
MFGVVDDSGVDGVPNFGVRVVWATTEDFNVNNCNSVGVSKAPPPPPVNYVVSKFYHT